MLDIVDLFLLLLLVVVVVVVEISFSVQRDAEDEGKMRMDRYRQTEGLKAAKGEAKRERTDLERIDRRENEKEKRRTLTIICLSICSNAEEQDLVRTVVLFSVVRTRASLVDVAGVF